MIIFIFANITTALMFKKILVVFILSVLCFFSASEVNAGGPPGPPMGPPPCWPPPCEIPIDGGISLLIVAGAALGGKRIYDLRKKSV